jgi:electron transport complex protein RnfC
MRILAAKHGGGGGVHPAYRKSATEGRPIEAMPLPALLRVSTSQHLGAPAKPVVKKGDAVLRGQPIAEAAGYVSAAVHAPTSGVVRAIAEAPTPTGGIAPAIEIEPDGKDQWAPGLAGLPAWRETAPKDLVNTVAAAGIAGMGGAGFPTHVKLTPPADKPIDTLIINGAECEPFLTADHRLMVERAESIWGGASIVRRILGARTVRLAIEDNKPDAIASMEKADPGMDGDVAIAVLRTEYPQGAEKQQIYAVSGREVPSGGLPMDVGCLVENVGTAAAIWDAVVNGRPLTERVTTVTGVPVRRPANVLARIGAPYADLVTFCGGVSGAVAKVVSGGPMMGLAQHGLNLAVGKTTSGIVLLPPDAVAAFTSMPCIGCGRCGESCPMRLMPSELSQMIEAEDYDSAEGYDVMDCIECGCCAFVCPARRPLVQHMKSGKSRVMLRRAARQAPKAT